jgi:hypothetical protein
LEPVAFYVFMVRSHQKAGEGERSSRPSSHSRVSAVSEDDGWVPRQQRAKAHRSAADTVLAERPSRTIARSEAMTSAQS